MWMIGDSHTMQLMTLPAMATPAVSGGSGRGELLKLADHAGAGKQIGVMIGGLAIMMIGGRDD